MAKYSFKEAYIEINSVDFSSHCDEVEINLAFNEEETTNFGTGGGEEQIKGLKTDSLQVTLHQDFAAAEVHDTLYPLYVSDTSFPVVIRGQAGPVGPQNPQFEANCKLFEYPVLSGSPGDVVKVQIDLKPQNTGVDVVTS